MNARERPAPRAAKILGTVLILVLPWVAVDEIRLRLPQVMPWAEFIAVFGLVTIAAQLGLIIRRWGKIKIWAVVLDVLLAAAAGAVSYGVVDLAVRRGGGRVDPSLIAVFLSYVLAIWSGQNR
jgi:uncharacterized membrane protein